MVARTRRPKAKLTRDVKDDSDWFCPCHGKHVVERSRWVEKDDGSTGYGGSFYACADYRECGYYVTLDGKVPVTDGNGIALGRVSLRKARRRT